MIRTLLISTAIVGLAGSATAQSDWPDGAEAEDGIARVIHDSMPDPQYEWTLDWTPFGTRIGRWVRWPLWPPNPYRPVAPPPGQHDRGGWATVNGRPIDVDLCGDEDRVGLLHLSTSDIWLGDGDLTRELSAMGVVVTPLESRAVELTERQRHADRYYRAQFERHPRRRAWRLERPGAEPVRLTAGWTCTPPGTRSATRCEMNWTVVFRPDERAPDDAGCIPPRRASDSPS